MRRLAGRSEPLETGAALPRCRLSRETLEVSMPAESVGNPDCAGHAVLTLESFTQPPHEDAVGARYAKRTPTRHRNLTRPETGQDRFDGLDRNEGIEPEGAVLDIREVVLEPAMSLLATCCAPVNHLNPTGYPGLHQVTIRVERNSLRKSLSKLDLFRARPHQAHVSFQDIPELRDPAHPRG